MPISTDIPTQPDFSFIENEWGQRDILYKSYDIIYTNNWFDHVYNYYDNVGYTTYVSNPLYDNQLDEEVLNIIYQIRKINTNGNGIIDIWITRQIEHIVVHGYTKYKEMYMKGIFGKLYIKK
jgi:hypothetical protein